MNITVTFEPGSNPSTQEAKAGESQIGGQPELHCLFVCFSTKNKQAKDSGLFIPCHICGHSSMCALRRIFAQMLAFCLFC